ncbi:MAG: hypothetical protein FWD77_07230 [Betaproteobacteria bacterium]|nr:hypothetical protein [Betaproteobacteria bacterium]
MNALSKRTLGSAALAFGLSLAAPAWADASFNAMDNTLSISSLNVANVGLFCNVAVRLGSLGQWEFLSASECPASTSASDTYDMGTGILSLPHLDIPGAGEFINVSATLDINTWRWNLVSAESPQTGNPSIAACFSADKAVSYTITGAGNQQGIIRRTIGPATYKGQAVTGDTEFFSTPTHTTQYLGITSTEVTILATVYQNGDVLTYSPTNFLWAPLSIQPGQSFDRRYTFLLNASPVLVSDYHTSFVGYETIILAGRSFSNVCHFREHTVSTPGGIVADAEWWFAPGYGAILFTNTSSYGDSGSYQYAGSL